MGVVTTASRLRRRTARGIGAQLKIDHRAGPAGRLKSKTAKVKQQLGRTLKT